MEMLKQVRLTTGFGEKTIGVHLGDIVNITEPIDILAVSAFYRSYNPTRRTLFAALQSGGIDARVLAQRPLIDLREPCNVWLSREITGASLPIGRIGCVELSHYTHDRSAWQGNRQRILDSIQQFFLMLDIAASIGVKMDTVALPLLGSGNQGIDLSLTLIPMLHMCAEFLERNPAVRRVVFVERGQEKAFQIAAALNSSYAMQAHQERPPEPVRKQAFISYSTPDRAVADRLCDKLEQAGVNVWYAPRNVEAGAYGGSITRAIRVCTHFVLILSRNSLGSQDVLNELDLAFCKLRRNEDIRLCPLRLDDYEFNDDFNYYLSRQHWKDAFEPPLERRLDEFVDWVLST